VIRRRRVLADERAAYTKRAEDALLGKRLIGVSYADIHNFSDEPREWDHGDWHHAVMGVGFDTDGGPACVTWTSTFFSHGIEAFAEPLEAHLVLDPHGPEMWSVSEHPYWSQRRNEPVLRVGFFWEHVTMGPGRTSTGEVVRPAEQFDVPLALRMDFASGPVWMLAAIPRWPEATEFFPFGDELMIFFSPDALRKMGFPADPFVDDPAV
jgi:hypothetical protein